MFELYGVGKDGMVYRSPPPRRKEVDILSEVGRTSPAKDPLLRSGKRYLLIDLSMGLRGILENIS